MINPRPTLALVPALALLLAWPAARADAADAAPAPAPKAATAAPKTAAAPAKTDASATKQTPKHAKTEAEQVDTSFATGGIDTHTGHKPWSVILQHSFGFGLQTDQSTAYYYGQLGVLGTYRVSKFISVWASTGLYYTPDPKPNDARSLDAGGLSVSVRDASIYKEKTYTGLTLSGSLGLGIPLGMHAAGQLHYPYPSVGASLALGRSLGPVAVRYGISFHKYNPADDVYISSACAAAQPVDTCYGGYQKSWSFSQSISAVYSPLKTLTLSGSFAFVTGRSFGPSSHLVGTGPSVVDGLPANLMDGFSFSLSANWNTPVHGLSAGLSFSNGGPWRSNGQAIYNPLFDPRLASMSIDISYAF